MLFVENQNTSQERIHYTSYMVQKGLSTFTRGRGREDKGKLRICSYIDRWCVRPWIWRKINPSHQSLTLNFLGETCHLHLHIRFLTEKVEDEDVN